MAVIEHSYPQYGSLPNPDSLAGIDLAGSIPLAWVRVVISHLRLVLLGHK